MLVDAGVHVIPRVPLIPGYTMTEQNLNDIVVLLQSLALKEIHLLPFHQLGESKYTLLDMPYSMRQVPVPTPQQIEQIKAQFLAAGFLVSVGG